MITILKLEKNIGFYTITIKYIFNAFIPQERRKIHEGQLPVHRLHDSCPSSAVSPASHLTVSLSFSVLPCTHMYIAVKG